MKILRRIGLALLVIVVLAAAGFTVWSYTPPRPMPEAIASLKSDAVVRVETRPWLTFTPAAAAAPVTGFIFYPGGRVDPRSYAPAAQALAARGYLVVIVPMPFNLAVFGAGKASAVIAAHPEVRYWAIGGHSLGGAMAASFVYGHRDAVQGIVFWAAYPAGNNSLADRNIQAISIYGTRDGLATGTKIDVSRALLPANTRWVAIEGGNHAQFGWYGAQPGDQEAAIDRAVQQEQAIRATEGLLRSLKSQ